MFSLTAALAREPAHVPAVRFMNFEGQPEAADLRNRIEQVGGALRRAKYPAGAAGGAGASRAGLGTHAAAFPCACLAGVCMQVSLFRVHKHFITPEAQHYRPKYVLGGSAGEMAGADEREDGRSCSPPACTCAAGPSSCCCPTRPFPTPPPPLQPSSPCMPMASLLCVWTPQGCARWGRTSLLATPPPGEAQGQPAGCSLAVLNAHNTTHVPLCTCAAVGHCTCNCTFLCENLVCLSALPNLRPTLPALTSTPRPRHPPAALSRWQTAANPRGEWQDTVSDDSVVLHYAYSYPEEVAAKAHRSCPDTFLEAARRGDKAKVGGWLWVLGAAWGAAGFTP